MSADLAHGAAERVPTDPRLSRRRRAVARLRRRRIAARAVAGCALLAALWLALWSPLLRVRSVDIVGGRHTTAADVARAARLSSADNLLLLSTGDVATMTEGLPWVLSAKVERRLPGTLKVSVTERDPELILVTKSGHWTIDERAHVLAPGRKGSDLPVLRTRASESASPGEVVSHPGARAALRAYRSLRRGMRRRVEEVFARSPERIGFRLEGGTLVRWGGAERPRAKRAVLRALFDRLAREGRTMAYVDVSVPESPAVSSLPFGTEPAELPRGRRRGDEATGPAARDRQRRARRTGERAGQAERRAGRDEAKGRREDGTRRGGDNARSDERRQGRGDNPGE
jgi:cell division protein FtsQ